LVRIGQSRPIAGRANVSENLNMPGKQAKIVTPLMLKRMLRHTSCSPFPLRDRALVLLSMKAGLQAREIASLDWSMVLDARGKVDDAIAVREDQSQKCFTVETPQHSRSEAITKERGVLFDLRRREDFSRRQRMIQSGLQLIEEEWFQNF